jgi:hypothetical protein
MMNQVCFTFCQKLFRSNDHFSKKIIRSNELSVICHFGHLTSFSSYIFGKMTIIRSNELSVICHFGLLTSFSSYIFGKMTIFQIFSVKRPFKINFRSNGFRLNGDSDKYTFNHQMVFGQRVFGQMVFRSNGLSVEWPFGKKISVK